MFTPNVDIDQSLLQVKAGQADLDIIGIPPTAASSLAAAVRRQQGPLLRRCDLLRQLHGDEQRPRAVRQPQPPQGCQLRDRPAGAGPPARRLRRQAHRSDPRSGHPGLQAVQRVLRSRVPTSRRRSRSVAPPSLLLRRSTSSTRRAPTSTNRAQVAEYNLKAVGFKINDVPTPATNYYQVIQTKGTTYNFVTERWLVRRLLRPVRLPERAVRRPQDPGLEQQRLHVLQQRELQQGARSRQPLSRARRARTRTPSSTRR